MPPQTQRATAAGVKGASPPCRRRRFHEEPWHTTDVPFVEPPLKFTLKRSSNRVLFFDPGLDLPTAMKSRQGRPKIAHPFKGGFDVPRDRAVPSGTKELVSARTTPNPTRRGHTAG